jgi:hypothetical protein
MIGDSALVEMVVVMVSIGGSDNSNGSDDGSVVMIDGGSSGGATASTPSYIFVPSLSFKFSTPMFLPSSFYPSAYNLSFLLFFRTLFLSSIPGRAHHVRQLRLVQSCVVRRRVKEEKEAKEGRRKK